MLNLSISCYTDDLDWLHIKASYKQFLANDFIYFDNINKWGILFAIQIYLNSILEFIQWEILKYRLSVAL